MERFKGLIILIGSEALRSKSLLSHHNILESDVQNKTSESAGEEWFDPFPALLPVCLTHV